MVAVSDFSGLTRCACALAKAAARAANDSLDRCTGGLRIQDIEAHRSRFRALRAHAMADRLLGILGNEIFELTLCPLVIEKGAASIAEQGRELRPGIGCTHIHDADGLDARLWRLDAEEARRLAALDAAPEFLLRGQQEVLVERISGDRNFNPLAAAGDHRERRQSGIG